jgi:hypothetical protein
VLREEECKSSPVMNDAAHDTITSTGTNYRPYTLKDYKDRVKTNSYQYGGLGPNILTDEWQKRREKLEKMA